MNRDISDWISLIFWLFLLLLYGIQFLRFFRSRFGKPRTVKAEVIGKQTVEQFSKYGGKKVRYVVNFLVDGRKKSFYVSEFSYNGYRKGERGQLTYRGDRLIEFR